MSDASHFIHPITEDDIANYLVNTPAFFQRHAELLAAVQLSSPHSQRAVSLPERQATLLREKIHTLEQRIMDMMRHASDNMALTDKLLHWTGSLLGLTGLEPQDLPQLLTSRLAEQFLLPQVVIKLWQLAPAYAACDFASGMSARGQALVNALQQPLCTTRPEPELLSCLPEPQLALSMALLPLRDASASAAPAFGVLLLASPDAQRFGTSMSTDFLSRMAQLASAALRPLRLTDEAVSNSHV